MNAVRCMDLVGGIDDEGGVDEIACGCAYMGLINCIADSREINTVEIPGKKAATALLPGLSAVNRKKRKIALCSVDVLTT